MKRRILPFLALMMLTTVSFGQARQIQVTVADSIVDKVQVLYIAGSFNGWSEPGDLMTKVTDSTFTYDFEKADTVSNYKFLTGPAWKYEQVRAADYRYSTDSITRVNTFKAYYDTAQAKDVTIEVLVPATVQMLYITGTFNGWTADANEMVQVDSSQDGKVYSATFHSLDTTTLRFKFIAGPGWPFQQKANDFIYTEVGSNVVCDEFKNIYNSADVGNITINIKVPEGTPDVWIIGTFANWNKEDALHATKVTDTTWTVTLENVLIVDYKVYNFPDWAYEEAKDEAGNSLDVDRQVSIYDGETFDIEVAFWKDIHEAPTGVDNHKNSEIRVYTTRYQTIVAEGVVEKVTVFDMQGRIVQDVRTRGTFTSKALRTGVYIIRVDNNVKKVAIQ